MQSLTIMDMVVIDDYYHMITFDDVNWFKLAQILLSIFSLNLMIPFCVSTFTSICLIAFLNVEIKEK